MRQANMMTIKQTIMQIRFGILKTIRTSALKTPASLMIETSELTDDGCLICTTTDASAYKRMMAESLGVTLKYVRKSEGLFIKVSGRTVISNSTIRPASLTPTSRPNYGPEPLVIKILIEDVHCFKKTCTSPYTSFLQTLSIFTGYVPELGRAV